MWKVKQYAMYIASFPSNYLRLDLVFAKMQYFWE